MRPPALLAAFAFAAALVGAVTLRTGDPLALLFGFGMLLGLGVVAVMARAG